MNTTPFRCYLVSQSGDQDIVRSITSKTRSDLPDGDVLIRVTHSSLNYKDALAAVAHRGIVQSLPHVPGIDAAGQVLESRSKQWSIGDDVLVTGYGLGSDQWGGWSELIQVPANWVVRLPDHLSAVEAMTLGTAGFTAAQCVESLQQHGVTPDAGEIIVTGASGGVGSLAIAILAKLGYQVVAMSGKPTAHHQLRALGASDIVDRAALTDTSDKSLLRARWAGAVDTVGGNTLATIVRSTQHRGCIAACGLVGGIDLPLTVYPFLLRGITLDGIDSAACPRQPRLEIWDKLAEDWKPEQLEQIRSTVGLDGLDEYITRILAGQATGRIVVDLQHQAAKTSH